MFAITRFKGMVPKISPLLLPPGVAELARDCSFRRGKLVPMRRPVVLATTTTAKQGIAVFPDGTRVLFDKPVRSVYQGNRIVFTKEGSAPSFVEADAPTVFHRLGMPRPATAPAVDIVALQDNAVRSRRRFAYTYINAHGDESDPSDLSSDPNDDQGRGHDLGPNDDVDLTVSSLPTGEGWDERATSTIQVYVTGIDSANLFPIDHTVVNGKLRVDLAQPVGLPLQRYAGLTIPPTGLRNIQPHPDGFWVGVDDDTIRMSAVGDLSKWPEEFSYKYQRGSLVGLAVHVDHVYVFPRGQPPLVMFMTNPATPQVTQTTVPWPCVSEGSITPTGFGVFYASLSGIVAMNGVQGQLLTKGHFDRYSFSDYHPEDIRGFEIDGTYHCYGNGKPFLLDIHAASEGFEMSEMSITPHDVAVVDGNAYAVDDGSVLQYEVPGPLRQFTWTSGLFRLPHPITLGALQIRADYRVRERSSVLGGIGHEAVGLEPIGLPDTELKTVREKPAVGFTMLDEHDDVLYGPVTVSGSESCPLALPFKVDTFKLRLSADVEVDSVAVAPTQYDLATVES